MKIGVPKEIKILEARVGLIPAACASLIQAGHEVFVEQGSGELSGYSDVDYQVVGAQILPNANALFAQSQMIVKVKEPIGPELDLLQKHHLLFSYLHLAAAPELTLRLLQIGLTGVAFESLEADGLLPLLAPMSDIAGRLSIQIGMNLLHRPQGGKGVLLGGLAAAKRGNVVIIGGGVAGFNAAVVAAGLGANVMVFDPNRLKQEFLRSIGANVTALYPFSSEIAAAVVSADLLVGAVLVPADKAPHIVTEAMVKQMQQGSVIIDISVDQGGCVATTKPTSYADPTFELHGVTHFGVTNMPGAVPRTASEALSASVLPFVLKLAKENWRAESSLRAGINVENGKVIHPVLQKLFPNM